MTLYREQVGTSSTYVRSNQITIHNPLDTIPSISFNEESIITLPDGTILHQNYSGPGNFLNTMYDPSGVINLINPLDDTPLGTTMTHQDLMVALYSLYRQLTTARDTVV